MTFYLESLGCAKNQVDSERTIAALERRGLRWVDQPEEARVILVNTCGFISSAKEQSIEVSLSLKERYPDKAVIMFGCLVERHGAELERGMKEIDGFVSLQRADELPELALSLAASRSENRGPAAAPSTPQPPPISRVGRRLLSLPGSAYLKVAEGCANRCSYCAIPLIRGPLVSRSRSEILREAEELLDGGRTEIILIAQDLASYGRDRGGSELVELVKEIAGLRRGFWLRLLYLHPDHFPLELLDLAAADRRILPYFDIPFQHASQRVLTRMGRKGTAERYLRLVQDIRRRLPGAVVRSTFLLGFPGEREEDVERLLGFQRDSDLDWVGAFSYSREEGTAASSLARQVPRAVAERRKRLVERSQVPITERRLARQVGRTLDVLVEEAVPETGLYLGRSYLQAPEVDGLTIIRAEGLVPGRIYPVRIDRRLDFDLEGAVVC